MHRYYYFFINIGVILIPLLRSFEPKIRFYRKWNSLLPAILITATFFLVWDYFKTKYGVWGFNPRYIIGLKFFGLPIEEWLFFITVPYACAFIYETTKLYYFRSSRPVPSIKIVLLVFGMVLFTASFLFIPKAYTWSVLFIGSFTAVAAAFMLTDLQRQTFLLSFFISLIPMLAVNGLLTALPVVLYNNQQNTGIRAGSIPLEDFLYAFILLAMNTILYEWKNARLTNPNKPIGQTDLLAR